MDQSTHASWVAPFLGRHISARSSRLYYSLIEGRFVTGRQVRMLETLLALHPRLDWDAFDDPDEETTNLLVGDVTLCPFDGDHFEILMTINRGALLFHNESMSLSCIDLCNSIRLDDPEAASKSFELFRLKHRQMWNEVH
jgi:hypothetical protein